MKLDYFEFQTRLSITSIKSWQFIEASDDGVLLSGNVPQTYSQTADINIFFPYVSIVNATNTIT